jgi:glucan phosphoethanolaminetransferase (alkaline phosphatase superfamily)
MSYFYNYLMPTKLKHYLIELLSWCILPFLFTLTYKSISASPFNVITEHFSFVLLLIFLTQVTRLLINLTFKNHWLTRHLISLIYTIILLILLSYYALVLFGLKTWKHVITKELIVTYASQLGHLLETVQISFPLVIVSCFGLFFIVYVIINRLITQYDWTPAKIKVNKTLLLALLFSLFVFLVYWIFQYVISAKIGTKEPVKLTMLAGHIASNNDANQGLPIKSNEIISEILATKNYVPNPNAKKRNLIIILVDALRPDHTNIYGYPRKTTPFLSSLESVGELKKFTNVKSTCTETTCAHAGLLASRYTQNIVPNMLTLQAVLHEHSYTTRFLISGDHLNFYDIKKIYGKTDQYFDGGLQKKYYINDDRLILDATDALPKWDEKPVMLQYHLLSAHNLGKRLPEFSAYLPAKNYSGMLYNKPETKYTNYYDNGVLQTDWEIQQLLTLLKEKGYLKNTLVIIMADHGESLGEHGVFLHASSVYEQPLNIPLMFINYGYRTTLPTKFDSIASIIDIAPSVLKDFDMPIPSTWQGQAIQQFKQRDLTHFMMRPLVGFYDQTESKTVWKYWFNEETGEDFAFNLTSAPSENNNQFTAAPEHLKQKWQAYRVNYLNNLTHDNQQH